MILVTAVVLYVSGFVVEAVAIADVVNAVVVVAFIVTYVSSSGSFLLLLGHLILLLLLKLSVIETNTP